jgi:amino-acid N-acetyltransferase
MLGAGVNAIKLQRVDEADYGGLATLLAENNLLSGDLDGENKAFFAFTDENGWRVGVGGLELYGDVALLRSFLTVSCHRGQGLGGQMLEELLDYAQRMGVRHVYLFTENAADFFAKHGFERADRSNAPDSLRRSKQFGAHCRSADFLYRGLERG